MTSTLFIAGILFIIHSILICLDNLTCTFYDFAVYTLCVSKVKLKKGNQRKTRVECISMCADKLYLQLYMCNMNDCVDNICRLAFRFTILKIRCPNPSMFHDFHAKERKEIRDGKLEMLILHTPLLALHSIWDRFISQPCDKRLKVTIGFLFVSFFLSFESFLPHPSLIFLCLEHVFRSKHFCCVFSSV